MPAVGASTTLQHLIFLVRPAPGSAAAAAWGGAYAHAFIRDDDLAAAEQAARAQLAAQGWEVRALEHADAAGVAADEDEAEAHDAARARGCAFLLHPWPPEDQDLPAW